MVNLNGQEKTQKYITFSVPINKELENGKVIKYKLKLIYNVIFIYYQNLLSTYLKLIAKNVGMKTVNLNEILKSLKITNFLTISKPVEKNS